MGQSAHNSPTTISLTTIMANVDLRDDLDDVREEHWRGSVSVRAHALSLFPLRNAPGRLPGGHSYESLPV